MLDSFLYVQYVGRNQKLKMNVRECTESRCKVLKSFDLLVIIDADPYALLYNLSLRFDS